MEKYGMYHLSKHGDSVDAHHVQSQIRDNIVGFVGSDGLVRTGQ